MRRLLLACLVGTMALLAPAAGAQPAPPNQLVGTWRMVSAQIDPSGANTPAYGPEPHGWLVFTPELTFIEVLTDPRVPRFSSDARGQGTDQENRAAMAGSIGFFGRYTVDENGAFTGNRVEGATFPNWVGSVRTRDDLRLTVEGNRMVEDFRRPEGTIIRIVWERVR